MSFAVVPSSGAAQRVSVSGGEVIDGPYLTGGRVAWRDVVCPACSPLEVEPTDVADAQTVERLRLAAPGRRSRVLDAERSVPARGGGEDPSPVVSRSYVLAGGSVVRVDTSFREMYGADEPDTEVRRIRAGRLGARLTNVTRCVLVGELSQPPVAVALDRGRLAYDRGLCSPQRPQLVVRDLASGHERAVAQPSDGRLVPEALSGRFLLARRTTGQPGQPGTVDAGLRVVNWMTGHTVVDIPRVATAAALDGDGSVALVRTPPDRSRDEPCRGTVEVLRAPAFRPQTVGGRACDTVRMTRGTVVFGADRRRGAARGFRPRTIRAVSPSNRGRTVARFADGEASAGFDADARSVLFGVQRCDGRQDIVRVRLRERPFRSGSVACPVRFPTRAVRRVGTRLRVGVRCPRGCWGVLTLVRGQRRLASGAFRASRARVVSIRLTTRGRVLARRGGELRAVVLDRSGRRTVYRARVFLTR